VIGAITITLGSFAAMELVSYATHRWVMHGPGMGWHRSHHLPAKGRVERNDLFPLCFSALGIALFAVASFGSMRALFWVAVGVTAYGVLYLTVHDVCIHRRLPVRVPSARYLTWVHDAHRVHHVSGGEPYGMLLPLVSATARASARAASTRSARSRL
jgi:beta-carotene 3-hydroxylase